MKKIALLIPIFLILISTVLISGCTSLQQEQENQRILEGPYKVINVVDGDTLDIEGPVRIRLSGIDTPETGECYYQEATNALILLTLEKEVFLERDITNRGVYGRLLRYIYIDGQMVNGLLVYNGYAEVYEKYKHDTKRYYELKELEVHAKEKNLGIWNCTDPKEGCLYVRSKNSEIYHEPHCKWAKRIKPENLICYTEEWQIENLTKAKTC